jgi:hypothetical protein
MKKKITMICILKSGQVVKGKLDRTHETLKITEVIRKSVEDYFAEPDKYKENAGCLTFGKTTILMSEIAAISFKD